MDIGQKKLEIVRLREQENLTYREIGEALGISKNMAWVHYIKAKKSHPHTFDGVVVSARAFYSFKREGFMVWADVARAQADGWPPRRSDNLGKKTREEIACAVAAATKEAGDE